jgi:PAS domain S-box-containing protein
MSDHDISVLLVEDNSGDARLIELMLHESAATQYKVTVAASLTEGKAVLESDGVDVVLLDLSLPDSHGLQTIDGMLDSGFYGPVIVLTGLADESVGLEAVAKGAQDYLVKGQVDGNLLDRVIRYAIERKHTEQSLRESEARFRSLTENSPAGIYIARDGVFMHVNPALARMFAYTQDEMIGKLVIDVVHPDDRGMVEENIRRRISGETDTVHYVLRGLRKDCSVFEAEVLGGTIIQEGKRTIVGTLLDITERKQVEEELQNERNLLRTVIDNIPDYIFVKDTQGKLILVNQAVANDVAAKNPDEVIGKSDFDFLPRELSEQYYTGEQELMRTGQPRINITEEIILAHNQTSRWVLSTKVPLQNNEGKTIGLVGINRDITEVKQAQELVARQYRDLKILNEVISLSSLTLDVMGVLDIVCFELAAALEARRVTAALKDEQQDVFRVALESDNPANPFRVGSLLMSMDDPAHAYLVSYSIPLIIDETNQDQYPQIELVRAEGVNTIMLVPLKIRGEIYSILCLEYDEPHQFTEAELNFAVSIVQAISPSVENSLLHQRLTEQNLHLNDLVAERTAQLERANDRLATILNNTSDAILLLGANNRIRNANRSFDELFGYDQDALFDQPFGVLVEEDERDKLLLALQTAHESQQPQRLGLPLLHKNGQAFEAEIAIASVSDNKGHVVVSIRDITHLKEVERIKDRFVSMVSHELRTPITSVLLGSDTLVKYYDRLSDEKKREKLAQISKQAENLADLVTAILDISRLDARQGSRSEELVDVAQALEEVRTNLSGQAQAKHHDLRVQVFNGNMQVLGEHADIVRIWNNLVNNASKYTDDGGTINIALYGGRTPSQADYRVPNLTDFAGNLPDDFASGKYVIGIVEDNGRGIPPEDLPELFTRFFRGGAAGTNIPGTGLGLSLVRELLQLYDGDIIVSTEFGVGTTFCFWLPAHRHKGDNP